MMHEDDDAVPFLETLEDPNLSALSDLVMSLRCARMAAMRYQYCEASFDTDAPSGVLEGINCAEVHLQNAIATLGVSLTLDGGAPFGDQ